MSDGARELERVSVWEWGRTISYETDLASLSALSNSSSRLSTCSIVCNVKMWVVSGAYSVGDSFPETSFADPAQGRGYSVWVDVVACF